MLKRKDPESERRPLLYTSDFCHIEGSRISSKVLVSHRRFWFFIEDSSSLSKILEYWMINPI
jgi:hypothetical protein